MSMYTKLLGKNKHLELKKGRKNDPLRISKKIENREWESGLGEITSKYNNWKDRVRKSEEEEERQSALAKSAGLELKGTFEQRRSGWDKEENKAACFERGSTDRLKATCPVWAFKRQKMSGLPVISPNQKEKGKGKGKKGKSQSANLTCTEMEEYDEEENEEQEVNLTTRHVNLSGILGSGHWEEKAQKDWPKECSAIVDAGFNGGGLCSHAWMQRYVSYPGSFYPKTNSGKFKEGVLGLIFGNHQGRNSDSSTIMPIWVDGDFKPVKIRLINGKQNYFQVWIQPVNCI